MAAMRYLEGKIEVGWTKNEKVVAKQFVEFKTIINNDSEVRRTVRHATCSATLQLTK